MNVEDSLRLELEAERHCHRKDNEYLTKKETELRAVIERLQREATKIANERAALAFENERLRAALTWVDEVYPGKNAASGGAIVHMTWGQWNDLRRVLGLREQSIPDRYSQSVRIVKARNHEQSARED